MKSIVSLAIVLSLATAYADGSNASDILDYSDVPHVNDNFLEANFRFVLPEEESPPKAVLVFIPGTDGDGREVVNNPAFLSIARACGAALIGCNYRGEGLSYDDPTGGSGRALDDAISHFANAVNNPELATAPLLLIGYSQGGIFAYNYACCNPKRIGAFAALKAIAPQFDPKAESFLVPGLLIAGENDEPTRIRTMATAFSAAAGKHSQWAFLFEKKAGHELDQGSLNLTRDFLASAWPSSKESDPILLNSETGDREDANSNVAGACWLPDDNVAHEWQGLLRPVPLDQLIKLPDRPKLQDFASVTSIPSNFACENGTQQIGMLALTSQTEGLRIDHTSISGEGFSLTGSQGDIPPIKIQICFSPKQLPWGHVRADVEIDGLMKGNRLAPLSVSITGEVRGPVTAIPSMVYLGAVGRGESVDKQIQLKTSESSIHVLQIKAPGGINATIEKDQLDQPRLHIHWLAGNRLGRMNGEIQLVFDAPAQGTLRIPVVGVVLQ